MYLDTWDNVVRTVVERIGGSSDSVPFGVKDTVERLRT